MKVQTAQLLLLIYLVGLWPAHASDRLVEFSARTLPRLNQLPPAPVPTVLGPPSSPLWAINSTDGTVRPYDNLHLCLAAFELSASGAVQLFPCRNASKATIVQWHWDDKSGKLVISGTAGGDELCLSAAPVGIPTTLSLQSCHGLVPTAWRLVSNSSSSSSSRIGAASNPVMLGRLVTVSGYGLFPDSVHPGIRALVGRFQPVFKGAGPGDEQVLLGCYSWLLDLCTDFTGSPSQSLPILDPEAPQWSRGNATYQDLADLVKELRTAATARSIPKLKLGVMFVGWAALYNLKGTFSHRHPEVYSSDGTRLAHGKAWSMNSDSYPYASAPRGIEVGTSFFHFFGGQWAALSAFLDVDVIVLRDGLSTYANHGRHGPFGDTAAADPKDNTPWLDGVRKLFEEIKQASPSKMVLGYSQATSAVGGWRVALSDLEQLAADGHIDAWVDQSWAGAWEDVPTRRSKTLGWTFHLAYILLHRAQLEGGNRRRQSNRPRCKHYVLHGMFDAYEGFDTIHKVPQKLQWSIFAYSMGALVQPSGETVHLDGHYISWGNSYSYVSGSLNNPLDDDSYLNRPTGLLTRTDIAWLTSNLDAADLATAACTHIPGPTVLYDRASLERVMATDPSANVNEWIDEQLGVVLKYGVPVLKVARIEDGVATSGPAAMIDGVFLSVPNSSHVTATLISNLTTISKHAPVVIIGRCDTISPALLKFAGAGCGKQHPPFYGQACADCRVTNFTVSLAERHSIQSTLPDAQPLITLRDDSEDFMAVSRGNILYLQLNDYTSPVTADMAVLNYGQAHPHYLIANRSWPAISVVSGLNETHPVSVHLWWEGPTKVSVLIGNLEGNHCGTPCSVPTALTTREIELSVDVTSVATSQWLLTSNDYTAPLVLPAKAGHVGFIAFLPELASSLYHLTALPSMACEPHSAAVAHS